MKQTAQEIKDFEEMSRKAYDALAAYHKEVRDHNTKILEENNIPTKDFDKLTCDCTINDKMEIVDGPTGTNQDEKQGVFKQIYVDQWSVGMEGDSFEGFIYGKIANKKWLKIPYSC